MSRKKTIPAIIVSLFHVNIIHKTLNDAGVSESCRTYKQRFTHRIPHRRNMGGRIVEERKLTIFNGCKIFLKVE
jgi:hypothetical protein